MIEVQGTCDPRFAPVRDTFAANFDDFDEVGAAVAVEVDGQPVVDLWAGSTDEARSDAWQRDTLVGCASTTKGLVGLCANMLVDRGLLNVDAPVVEYWPEFAQGGKEATLVRHLMDHRAGLITLTSLTSADALLDWDTVIDALAAQEPAWTPGTQHGYHAITYGFLVGEIVRRISGISFGAFLREEVAEPLGVEFYVGTPADADARCAESVAGPGVPAAMLSMGGDPTAFRRAEIPSGNGHGNARALATIYGVLGCGGSGHGVTLVSRDTVLGATSYEVTGPWFDRADGGFGETRFAQGFVLNSSVSYMGPNARAFGYSGFGGSIGFGDMEASLGFGYTPNAYLSLDAGQASRSGRLVDAVYASL